MGVYSIIGCVRSRTILCRAVIVTKTTVIPTGAEPLDFARGRLREAQWRDLFCCFGNKNRSLDYAALRAASLGKTGNDKMRVPAKAGGRVLYSFSSQASTPPLPLTSMVPRDSKTNSSFSLS